MIKGRSKQKGNKFEWKISKQLSEWWTDKKRDDVFVPSRMSGGWASSRKKVGKETKSQFGDIALNDPIGEPFIKRYNIELKNYKDFRIDEFMRWNSKGNLFKFWKQCKKEAFQSSRLPFLIIKRNNFTELLVIELSEYSFLKDCCGGIEPVIKVHNSTLNLYTLCIIPLNNFFDIVDPIIYNK